MLSLRPSGAAAFVPVVAETSGAAAACAAAAMSSVIEIELVGMTVRVRGLVPAGALAEVLTAVKRAG
jgi:hypothetical protein